MEEQNVAVQYFLPFTIAMIMLSMGLGLVVDDFRRIFDKPRAVLVGLASQLVLLPVLGFGWPSPSACDPSLPLAWCC